MATFFQYRDELKTCPYNPSHKVSTRRYQLHIVKCANNPLSPHLKECPFNTQHRVPAEQLERHILTCKDNAPIIREIEETRHLSSTETSSASADNRSVAPISLENWDEEDDTSEAYSYLIPGLVGSNSTEENADGDEKTVAIKSNIEIQGMKRADRKKYYAQQVAKARERVKLNESMKGSNGELESQASLSTTSESMVSAKEDSFDSSPTEDQNPRRVPTFGIGRGLMPLMSSRRMVGQRRDSDKPTMASNVGMKRKRFEDATDIPDPKRRSSQIPF